ncbi:MAG: hypothetical protein FWC68_02080 [Oscillospiraceae bacterium]|nr:hypothetical protein [Oscillospiraceae bacterium]
MKTVKIEKGMLYLKFDKETLENLKNQFDLIINVKEDIEFWYARDLQEKLGYKHWESFLDVIKRAMNACENSGFVLEDHFRRVPKMVKLGSGAERSIDDYMLTRYACYLIAQNGDSKSVVYAYK